MDHVFAIAATNRFSGLLLNREELAKPNSYFHEIRPDEAAEVDGRLAAERAAAEEKAKAAAAAKAATATVPKPAAPVAGVADPGALAKDGPASPRPDANNPATGGAATP